MADAAPATPHEKKGEKKPKTVPSHPVYAAMIKAAIKELKDRKGASKQAISKFIQQKYKLGDNEKKINAHLRMALKKGVSSGTLKQTSGSGASGRFHLAEKGEDGENVKPNVAKKSKSARSPKKAATKPKKVKQEKVGSYDSRRIVTEKWFTSTILSKISILKGKTPRKSKSPKKAAKSLSPKKSIVKKATKPKSPKKPTVKKAAAPKA
uniref:H15 domain-containing protein n=1 Tax=Angiostrongylus cantonensis TaxID=6313 RepID=A0A0K0DDX5_ANGCA